MELRGKCRLEQVLFRRREMERTSSIPTLPTMALGRCRSKPKQSSAGGLDMHAVYAEGPPSVGQSGPGLYRGGVNLSSVLYKGSATTPHSDGACGFLKFWSLNLTGNCSALGGACSSPGNGQSRAVVCWFCRGHFACWSLQTQPSRGGVMPLSGVQEELRQPGLTMGLA
jgi:hypothetical protein